jgi:hypothetical protein
MCDEYGNYIGDGYSDDNASFTLSYSSYSHRSNKRNREIENAKRLDPGYNKIHRLREFRVMETLVDKYTGETNKYEKIVKKRVPIELYTTTLTPGYMIRSALGGSYHSNYKVGTSDEYIFYKVALSTGECRSSNGSNTLFFDTPEQYENVFEVSLPQNKKNEWYDRFNAERKYREELVMAEAAKAAVLVK